MSAIPSSSSWFTSGKLPLDQTIADANVIVIRSKRTPSRRIPAPVPVLLPASLLDESRKAKRSSVDQYHVASNTVLSSSAAPARHSTRHRTSTDLSSRNAQSLVASALVIPLQNLAPPLIAINLIGDDSPESQESRPFTSAKRRSLTSREGGSESEIHSPRGSLTPSSQNVSRFPPFENGVRTGDRSRDEEGSKDSTEDSMHSSAKESLVISSTGTAPLQFIERPTMADSNAHTRLGSLGTTPEDGAIEVLKPRWELLANNRMSAKNTGGRRPSTESTLSLMDHSRLRRSSTDSTISMESFAAKEVAPQQKRMSLLLAVQNNEVKRRSTGTPSTTLADFVPLTNRGSLGSALKGALAEGEGTSVEENRRYSAGGPHRPWRYSGGKRPFAPTGSELRIQPSPIIEHVESTEAAVGASKSTSLPSTPTKDQAIIDRAAALVDRSTASSILTTSKTPFPHPILSTAPRSIILDDRKTAFSLGSIQLSTLATSRLPSLDSQPSTTARVTRRRATSLSVGPTKEIVLTGDLRFDRMHRRISSLQNQRDASSIGYSAAASLSSSTAASSARSIAALAPSTSTPMDLLSSFKELRSSMLAAALLPIKESAFASNYSTTLMTREAQVEAILPTLRALQHQMTIAAGLIDQIIGLGDGNASVSKSGELSAGR